MFRVSQFKQSRNGHIIMYLKDHPHLFQVAGMAIKDLAGVAIILKILAESTERTLLGIEPVPKL